MTVPFKRLLIILIVILSALLEPTMSANASGLDAPERQLSNLTIEPLKPFVTGDHPTIVVHLTSEFGKPIPSQPIIILVDGGGAKAGSIRWLREVCQSGRYRSPATIDKVIEVMDLREFLTWVNRTFR